MYELFFNFVIYSFLGWCCEVVFAAAVDGKFVNRGFLNGPVCPIYGFGVTIVFAVLNPIKDNLFVLFIGSVILTSALELVTGFVLEKLFHQRWWDYTDKKFNIGGYICLEFSLLWGMACIIVVDVVQSMTVDFINFIPRRAGVVALWIIGILFAADLIVTVIGINNLNRKMRPIATAAWRLNRLSNKIGENLSGTTIKTINHAMELKEKNGKRIELIESKIDEIKSNPIFDKDEFAEELRKKREEFREKYANMSDIKGLTKFTKRRLEKAFPNIKEKFDSYRAMAREDEPDIPGGEKDDLD